MTTNRSKSTGPNGFTLIELMIVVAIIGILASVAIPSFARYQLRAKSTEVKANLSAIRIVEEAIFSESGQYLAAVAEPPAIPGAKAVAFDATAPDFTALGWAPEGNVFFSYAVAVSGDQTGFTADAAADLDVDGVLQIWGYTKSDSAGAFIDGGLGCVAAALDEAEVQSCNVGTSIF